jgi:hypothetical protein
VTLPMRHNWTLKNDILDVDYQWKLRGRWNQFSIKADHGELEMPTGSKEEFITEHYWGYASPGNGKTTEYGVEHPRWTTYAVKDYSIDVDFEANYGSDFAYLGKETPASVMLAEGSEIVIRGKNKIL